MRPYCIPIRFSDHHGHNSFVAMVYDADRPRLANGRPETRHQFVDMVGPHKSRAKLDAEIERLQIPLIAAIS